MRVRIPIAGLVLLCLLATGACSGSDDPTASSTVPARNSAPSGSGDDDCPAGTLAASGSSAQQNAIQHLISSYHKLCAASAISYNPVGSGNGIKEFIAGKVDFAGSDSPLKTEAKDDRIEVDDARARCDGNDALNLPMVIGPVAITFNLPGVDRVTLTGPIAAKIFQGTITRWDDPAVAQLNPGRRLPAASISVVHRADESGTTENFTKYLKAAGSGAWTAEPAKKWTGTGAGADQSDGVVDAVRRTPNSISYVEWTHAVDSKLGIADLDTGSGPIELSPEAATKGLAAAKITGSGNDLRLEVDYATKAPGAYPIILVTYEIVCSKGLSAEKTRLVKNFLTYAASAEGQGSLAELSIPQLPDRLRARVAVAVDSIG